jgi:hypothetical protein
MFRIMQLEMLSSREGGIIHRVVLHSQRRVSNFGNSFYPFDCMRIIMYGRWSQDEKPDFC